ncbi:MAG: DUF445 domain-containing protein [Desulfohalobiaceae bacterium]
MEPQILKYLAAPFICAFIGWLTNFLAIKMLFRPRQPVRILGYTWQGLMPKRQKELAQKLGELVEQELVNHQDIDQALQDPEFQSRLRHMVDIYVHSFIQNKLCAIHPLLGSLLQGQVLQRIKGLIVHEVEKFIPQMVDHASEELSQRFKFSRIVQEKIEAFPMSKLEALIYSMMRTELRFIVFFGAVLGFGIGALQSVFLYVL